MGLLASASCIYSSHSAMRVIVPQTSLSSSHVGGQGSRQCPRPAHYAAARIKVGLQIATFNLNRLFISATFIGQLHKL